MASYTYITGSLDFAVMFLMYSFMSAVAVSVPLPFTVCMITSAKDTCHQCDVYNATAALGLAGKPLGTCVPSSCRLMDAAAPEAKQRRNRQNNPNTCRVLLRMSGSRMLAEPAWHSRPMKHIKEFPACRSHQCQHCIAPYAHQLSQGGLLKSISVSYRRAGW